MNLDRKILMLLVATFLISSCARIEKMSFDDGTPVINTAIVLEEDYVADYSGIWFADGRAIFKAGIYYPSNAIPPTYGEVFYFGPNESVMYTRKSNQKEEMYRGILSLIPDEMDRGVVGLIWVHGLVKLATLPKGSYKFIKNN